MGVPLAARSKETFVSPYAIAAIQAALGDKDQAVASLNQALDDRSYWIIYLRVDPALDALRDDPRFAELLERARLGPSSWADPRPRRIPRLPLPDMYPHDAGSPELIVNGAVGVDHQIVEAPGQVRHRQTEP